MANWTGDLGEWVTWIPDFQGNAEAPQEDQVSMEIRVLNHKQKVKYTSLARNLEKITMKDILGIKNQAIKDNVRGIKNLEHSARQIESAQDLLDTQSQEVIDMIYNKIQGDNLLTKEEVKN